MLLGRGLLELGIVREGALGAQCGLGGSSRSSRATRERGLGAGYCHREGVGDLNVAKERGPGWGAGLVLGSGV